MPRRAKLEAQSITVTCPYCYEPQSERLSGSTNLTPDDIDRNQGSLKCSACGCDMALVYAGKVVAPLSSHNKKDK